MSLYTLVRITPFTMLIPIIVGVIHRKNWTAGAKLTFYYLLIGFCFNILGVVLAIYRINNLAFLHLYTLFEFLMLIQIIGSCFEKKDKIHFWLRLQLIAFPILAVSYVLITHALFKYNVVPRFTGSVVLITLLIYTLLKDLSNLTNSNQSSYNFITITGFLLYFSSSAALFGFSELISDAIPFEQIRILWNLHAIFTIILYLILTYAFLKLDKK